jgi:exosortase/archaeosortase family protein
VIKKKLKLNRKDLKEVAWFLIKFNLLAIPMYLIIYFNVSMQPFQLFLVQALASGLNAFGYKTYLFNSPTSTIPLISILGIDTPPIYISTDSTGWKSLYALVALALATPRKKLDKRIRFLTIGLPAIFIINYLRILSTILICLRFGFKYFDFVHGFLWGWGLIAAILAFWYIWLRGKI